MCCRVVQLLAYADTTPTKCYLALSATLWCLALLLPGETMQYSLYRVMASLVGDHADVKWSGIWGLLAAGMWWRVFSSVRAPRLSMALNWYCVVVYSITAYSILTSKYSTFPVATVSDLASLFAALWVLVRTHVNSCNGWKID